MKKKKNNFLTFCFSLLPGAGHMYMGFMKMGISLMSAFFFIIFLSTWLDISPLLYILPVLWFYSFFDCINKRYTSDEEFQFLDDDYLFSIDKMLILDKGIFKKNRFFAGILFVLLGGYLVWNNIMHSLSGVIPDEIYNIINNITRLAPQMVLGVAIVVIGAKLIIGKKMESDKDA